MRVLLYLLLTVGLRQGVLCAQGPDPAAPAPADQVWDVGGLYRWDRTYPANTHLEDQRSGRRTGFHADIGTPQSPDGAGENVVVLHFSDPGLSTFQAAHQVAFHVGFLSIASGEIAYGRETDLVGFRNTTVCGTLSICQAVHTIFDATKGEGDSGGDYLEMNCWGGAFNGDDEGCKARSTAMYDGTVYGTLPMGRVTAVSADQRSLTMSVASVDGYTRSWGEGRYAVKVMSGGKDAVLFSVHALTQGSPSQNGGPHGHGAFGTVSFDPADGNLPVSTAWGQATTYFSIAATNDTATVVPITVTVDGPGPFKEGVVCWEGGHRAGEGVITGVGAVTDGQQSFSVSLMEDPDGGANQKTFYPWFFQGGLCGTIARPKAFDNGIGQSNQALPFLGATDAHTGVTGVHYNAGVGDIPGFGDSVGLAPSLRDLSLYRFYSAARIVGLKDPHASAGFLGSYLALEPHGWTAAVGDVIESPATYSTFMTMSSTFLTARLPGMLRGHDEDVQGAGINGGFVHFRFVNANSASLYRGFGGFIGGAPSLFDIAGLYSGLATFHSPAPGANLFVVGCSPLGCANPSSYHSLYVSYGANNAVWQETHFQYNNQVRKGFRNGESLTFELGSGVRLDTAGHGLDLLDGQIHRLAAPTSASDAATKGYVDQALGTGSTGAAAVRGSAEIPAFTEADCKVFSIAFDTGSGPLLSPFSTYAWSYNADPGPDVEAPVFFPGDEKHVSARVCTRGRPGVTRAITLTVSLR